MEFGSNAFMTCDMEYLDLHCGLGYAHIALDSATLAV